MICVSLCKACSTPLAFDSDILCKKHTEEFMKMKAKIDAGEDPPFGLIKEAWIKEAFGEIGSIIKFAPRSVLSPEEEIKKAVKKHNDNARSLMRNQQVAPDKVAQQRQLANTLGITF